MSGTCDKCGNVQCVCDDVEKDRLQEIWDFCDRRQQEVNDSKINEREDFLNGMEIAFREVQYKINKRCSRRNDMVVKIGFETVNKTLALGIAAFENGLYDECLMHVNMAGVNIQRLIDAIENHHCAVQENNFGIL